MFSTRHLTIALSAGALSLGVASLAPVGAHAKVTKHVASTAVVSGNFESIKSGWLTLQQSGTTGTSLAMMIAEANRLAAGDYPYVWGGGHGEAGIPSGGAAGETGTVGAAGFDCSGSVTAVLSAGGLWPLGTGVGSDATVIAALKKAKLIVAGAATGAGSVTLYDNPGVHIFMRIGSRYFGTSDGSKDGNKLGGPGWMAGKSNDAKSKWFKPYHFKPALLTAADPQGLLVDVAVSQADQKTLNSELAPSEAVAVRYSLSTYGIATYASVTGANTTTITGTITSVAANDASFVLQPVDGSTVTQAMTMQNYSGDTTLSIGDGVTVSYSSVTKGTATVNQVWSITSSAATSGGSPVPVAAAVVRGHS